MVTGKNTIFAQLPVLRGEERMLGISPTSPAAQELLLSARKISCPVAAKWSGSRGEEGRNLYDFI
jgi:hypothetical protein